jgi:phospholipid/cholesterol/gamma-HCH transport system substrate-binding protein
MEKGTPSIAKVMTMVLFALSCVGLLLFLWLSFGGSIPFKAQGYRVRISFPNAAQLAQQADVRIAGVSVGKVIDKSLDPLGNRTIATIELDRQYAPLRADARAILRLKTILGETYVELTPGSPNAKPVPDGGLLRRGNVVPAVQLDEVFSALDPKTRQDFQIWQQSLAQAIRGNDQNLNSVLGNLPQFAADATDITNVLDIQHNAVVSVVQNGGTVFAALSQDQNALRNLITTASTTFQTTAANNNALADTFLVFPTFLNETKLTMARLAAFAIDTDPLIKELNPVAQQLGPTLAAVRTLSPDLQRLFVNLGPLITASETGLPAFTEVLNGAKPLLGQLAPFLGELNPILNWLSLHQQLISDFISNGATGVSARAIAVPGGGLACAAGIPCHYLRQFQPASVASLGFFTTRQITNRGNTYPPPLWLQGPATAQKGAPPAWDCGNTGAGGDGSVPAGPKPNTGAACWVAPPQGNLIGQPQKFPHITSTSYSSK